MFPWFDFMIYTLVNAASPGPNAIASMSNATRLGFRKTLPFTLGIWAGLSTVGALCALLCDTLETLIPTAQKPMVVLGAAYILYLAWKLWNAGPIGELKSTRSGFGGGFLLPFINPRAYVYFIVTLQAYVIPVYPNHTIVLLFFSLFLAFCSYAFNLVWTAFGAVLRAVFSKYAHIINKVMALLLVWCAVKLFL